jgi:hypothetical protein
MKMQELYLPWFHGYAKKRRNNLVDALPKEPKLVKLWLLPVVFLL